MAGIARTLALLKEAGERHVECVVLWLANKRNGVFNVESVYRPQHVADFDYFHIPQDSVSELLTYLRRNRLMVAAQVHTHPGCAFHSQADDTWAIIRHIGGLSLVLPNFASTTSPDNFVRNSSVFRLSERNHWDEIPTKEVALYYKVTL